MARRRRPRGVRLKSSLGNESVDDSKNRFRATASRGLLAVRNLALSKVYQLIEPGPVVLLTTASNGKSNVMTMSWHMMVDFVPPLVACVVSSSDYSFTALMSERQCVIAIPDAKLAPVVVKVGNSSGRTIDKFKKFALTPLPAELVAAPLIGECFANLECKVVDTSLVDRFGIIVLEVVKAWVDPQQKRPKTIHHHGYGNFVVDGKALALKSKMP